MIDHQELKDKILEEGVIEKIITNSNAFIDVYPSAEAYPNPVTTIEDMDHIFQWGGATQLLYEYLKDEENLSRLYDIENLGDHVKTISEKNPPAASVIVSLF